MRVFLPHADCLELAGLLAALGAGTLSNDSLRAFASTSFAAQEAPPPRNLDHAPLPAHPVLMTAPDGARQEQRTIGATQARW